MSIVPQKDLISISEAAKIMNVSIDTLRRWDKSGKFVAIRSEGGHRFYSKKQAQIYSRDLFAVGFEWTAAKNHTPDLLPMLYCENSSIFQARLAKLQLQLSKTDDMEVKNIIPLVVAVAGEIGNNSFDHNLGNWSDIPGVFFGYDLIKKQIILADRGQGILQTLSRVRKNLSNDEEALRVAFTELVSGREPEKRGNGLKFVKNVVTQSLVGLYFQSNSAKLELRRDDMELHISKAKDNIIGCFAQITY